MCALLRLRTGWVVALAVTLSAMGATAQAIAGAEARGRGMVVAQAADEHSPKASNQQNKAQQKQQYIEILRSQVRGLLREGNLKGALSLLDSEIAKDRANTELYLLRASVYCFAEQLVACDNDVSRAIAADPNFVAAYLYRALVRLDLHQIRDALSDCETAVRLAPDLPAPYNCRGMVYRSMRDFATAISEFELALRKDAKFAPAHFNKGVTYAMQNQRDAALASFSAAIELDATHDDWFLERGKVLVAKAEIAAGRADFAKALALNDQNITAAASLQALQVAEALDVLSGKK